jgi:hypothetical protein
MPNMKFNSAKGAFMCLLLSTTQVHALDATNSNCRVLPSDHDWPGPAKWAALNETLRGKLIASVPLAIVCHDGPHYNEAACTTLRDGWDFGQT